MGLSWFLKPDWLLHAELQDQQEELELRSEFRNQSTREEIDQLRGQVRDLERQLLALETVLAAQGIIERHVETDPAPTEDCPPVKIPTRNRDEIQCPRCGKKQQANRDACYGCRLPFLYEDEQSV